MGSDLVVGAAAALTIHAAVIIIDMGTATTMTVIDREARVLGGAIIPGVGISLEALASGTSQLPHISLDAPKKSASAPTRSRPCAPAVSTARPPCSTA
ncbi:MAG: type III pantothenate kinase [Oscillospiraceae bacterium]